MRCHGIHTFLKTVHVIVFAGILLTTTVYSNIVPSKYVAYSLEELKIFDRAGTNSFGLIGSQGNVFIGFDAVISGSVYANGDIRLYDRAHITGSVVSEGSIIEGHNVIAGSLHEHTTVERYTIPTKNVVFGSNDIIVSHDGSLTLAPGNYNQILVRDRGSLIE